MKKFVLFVCCISFYTTAFSQTDANYNYSIGVVGFSSMQLPKILNQTNSQEYKDSYFTGVLVKFNDNQISYRVRADYYRKNITFANQCNTCEIAAGLVTDYSFTVGFEKNFNYAKIQPYFGVDLGFKANRFTGEIKSNNPKSSNLPYNVDADKNGFLIAPLLGIKVNPIKQLSLFVETNAKFYYAYERQETIQQDALNTRSFAKYNKWEFLVNPVSVGIQVHLISKN
ncbi:MAG: hypothetical protein REI78_05040 [Pedobacter sp.]|nr:hypothetical protein [Pedobacter sp.]MDQ8052364.1 hypothetical protein [Pedobacter sp.]